MRDEFIANTRHTLAERVASRCSKCGCVTSGPQEVPEKAINIGVAAHITAASPGGPRYDPNLSQEERCSISNGLWLCHNCAKLVDNEPSRYTEELLQQWKSNAESDARSHLGRPAQIRTMLHTQFDVASGSEQLQIDPTTGNRLIFDPIERTVTEYHQGTSTKVNVTRL